MQGLQGSRGREELKLMLTSVLTEGRKRCAICHLGNAEGGISLLPRLICPALGG